MRQPESRGMFWDDRKRELLGKGVFLLALLVIGMLLRGEPQAAVIDHEADLLIAVEKILLTIAVSFCIIRWMTE